MATNLRAGRFKSSMIYLDYQATTPVAPEVAEAMQPWISEKFANPHSPSRWGREAAAAIEVARKQVTKAIGLDRGRLAFTGSAATERDLLLAPLRQLGEAMLAIQWEILADRPRIEPRAMIDAVRSTGLLHPELIAWKIAADG